MNASAPEPPEIEVRPSPLGGLGVFALRPFAAGEVVLRWDVRHRVRRDEVSSLTPADQHFLVPLDDAWLILMQPPARYVNHSCAANTLPQGFCDVAVRPIRPGEEVTTNYFTNGATLSFACRCGAPNCISG